MSDDPRWDPEMRAARMAMDAAAAALPPLVVAEPLDPTRVVNDSLAMRWAAGGPTMAASSEFWISAHGRRVFCRLHRPPGREGPLPVLIWLHGGGWVWLTVDTHDRLARELAVAGEVAVLLVDYALSPEARFPQALTECTKLVAAVAARAGAWGLDAARIVLGGDSAGGNLAFAIALALRDGVFGTPPVPLAGLLAYYPVIDPACASPSYSEFASGYGLTAERMAAFWRCYLRDAADAANPLAALCRADLTFLPPCWLGLAELDVLRSEGEAFAARLAAAGVACDVTVFPGLAHGFALLTEAVGGARRSLAAAGAWLRCLPPRALPSPEGEQP
jgi:acetyl esterase